MPRRTRTPAESEAAEPSVPARARVGRVDRMVVGGFALLCYVPVLLSGWGTVVADTKSYLYLDPARMLSRAWSMWDPQIGLGTVTHQNIGYLFPMGPFFWVTEHLLHLPPWVAQRLWLGSLLFLAGLGTRYLLRALHLDGPGVAVAMLAYAFSPYALEYSSRLSVLLGPWVALPWLIGFTVHALRRGGWRHAALFAIAVQLAGGVNASSLFFALLGPVVYCIVTVVGTDEVRVRDVWSFAWRVGLLVVLTSLWWLSGLWVEGRYGLNILSVTETIKDVSQTLFPFELVRGLGYWMFYGRDPGSFWNDASQAFTRNPAVVLASFLVPIGAMVAAATVRWRHRLFFVVLLVSGIVIGMASAPFDDPSIAGSLFKKFAAGSSLGLALRSTARATPLIALGSAGLLGAGVSAWVVAWRARGRTRAGSWTVGVAVAVCLANAAGLWTGTYYSGYLAYSKIPDYWRQALAAADHGNHSTRLMSIPGSDFAAYAWGDTVDPIEPGLIDRPFLANELVPWGSAPGANLVEAFNTAIQDSGLDPAALAPIARILDVGTILARLDMETRRFNLVPASSVWRLMTKAADHGISPPVPYGSKAAVARLRVAAADHATPVAPIASIPAVALSEVDSPTPIVHTRRADDPVVVAGDGQGLIDLAASGLLDPTRLHLYAATVVQESGGARRLAPGAVLVITDSNRRRGVDSNR